MPDALQMIEETLGRRLPEQEHRAIRSLNDVPSRIVQEARRLPTVLAHLFLRFYLPDTEHEFLPKFVEDVVVGAQDPASWRKGRFLVPVPPVAELMHVEGPSVFGTLSLDPNPIWKRMPVSSEAWQTPELTTGAPGMVRPELDYHYVAPPNLLDFLLVPSLVLEDVGEIRIAVRRWIASRVARHLSPDVAGRKFRDADSLIRTVFPGVSPTNDARVAVAALLRESELRGDGVPGFRGPDSWYAA
jgi:hypothetical protein